MHSIWSMLCICEYYGVRILIAVTPLLYGIANPHAESLTYLVSLCQGYGVAACSHSAIHESLCPI